MSAQQSSSHEVESKDIKRCLLHLIAQQSCFKLSRRALHPAAISQVMPPHPAWAALARRAAAALLLLPRH